ncbi:MAG: hypothetical protein IKS93_05205 [Methanobrevibacter sp.]|nr:hypothetical protein [Methanobrevibacter sp.]
MLENIELFGNSLGVDNKSVLQNIFDVIHPVGEIYVQYPQQSSPIELYNNSKIKSVWEEQLQYDSAFFRANKGTGDGTYIYKVSNETQYYAADINGNPTIPVKAIADNGGTITLSQEGASKIYDGKTYLSYKINGANNSAAGYINETNSLSKQDNQNKYHNHSGNTGYTQPNISGTAAWISLSGWTKSVYYNIDVYQSDGIISTDGPTSGIEARARSVLDPVWTRRQINVDASHSHSVSGTADNHRHSISYDGDSTYQESRPDNYTIRIWKRIS